MKAAITSIIVLAWVSPALAQEGGAAANLARADANHDGEITRAEFDAMRSAEFDRLDLNRDGSLVAAELQGAGRMRGQLSHADTNGDGRLTRTELLSQPPRGFIRFDANRNSVLEPSEVSAMRAALRAFGG
ncbi:MAG: hypothetical protein IPL62_10845 [Caulobacteraceae bacterium]|nr:hypothetical protein [Caulobacteraceae bacterium]